jgi:sugar phosphate isomerase/epimerase
MNSRRPPGHDLTVGLFTDGLRDLTLEQTIERATASGIRDLELGTGGTSPSPHLDLDEIADDGAVRRLLALLERNDVRISALNCSGNPLFPDPRNGGNPHDEALRRTLVAAARLGVGRVVCMSGCPAAGPGQNRPAFVPIEWFPEDVEAVAWQWHDQLLPYWRDVLTFARTHAPEVVICLELDPGMLVYTPRAFRRLAESLDTEPSALRVNLDPSHLFWQGMDPIKVARTLGPLIGHVHGKDTVIDAERVQENGLLAGPRASLSPDEWPFRFATVGDGHDRHWWTSFCEVLVEAGYRGPISIEWEDDRVDPASSISRAAEVLHEAIEAVAAARSPA